MALRVFQATSSVSSSASIELSLREFSRCGERTRHVPALQCPLEDPVWTACEVDATAYRKKQMAKARDKTKARDKVRICAHARIVGVVFWDRPHNVSGRAPNSIELHPILGFACFSS
jgi:hypothetical protein